MIWGADLATRCTGITAGVGDEMPAVGVWHFEHCGDDLGQLLADLDRNLCNLADRMPPTAVVYEAPVLVKVNTLLFMRKVHAMGGYLELWCRRRNVICEEASPSKLKKALTGDHAAPKAAMVQICRRLGVKLPTGEAAKDAADSFACWYVGLQGHGREHLTKWDTAIYGRRGSLT